MRARVIIDTRTAATAAINCVRYKLQGSKRLKRVFAQTRGDTAKGCESSTPVGWVGNQQGGTEIHKTLVLIPGTRPMPHTFTVAITSSLLAYVTVALSTVRQCRLRPAITLMWPSSILSSRAYLRYECAAGVPMRCAPYDRIHRPRGHVGRKGMKGGREAGER